MTMTREQVKAALLEAFEDALDGYGLHTGGSYGVELDYEDKVKILAKAAEAAARRICDSPTT